MKKIALIAALVLASAASAQSIVAHVNVDSLLVQMPEYKLAQEALQAEQAKFESEAKEMNADNCFSFARDTFANIFNIETPIVCINIRKNGCCPDHRNRCRRCNECQGRHDNFVTLFH